MNKKLFVEPEPLTEDNWDWQGEVLQKIRAWFKREKITIEDAFRSADKDFDGYLPYSLNKVATNLFINIVSSVNKTCPNSCYK